jgi:hypothetical protein
LIAATCHKRLTFGRHSLTRQRTLRCVFSPVAGVRQGFHPGGKRIATCAALPLVWQIPCPQRTARGRQRLTSCGLAGWIDQGLTAPCLWLLDPGRITAREERKFARVSREFPICPATSPGPGRPHAIRPIGETVPSVPKTLTRARAGSIAGTQAPPAEKRCGVARRSQKPSLSIKLIQRRPNQRRDGGATDRAEMVKNLLQDNTREVV